METFVNIRRLKAETKSILFKEKDTSLTSRVKKVIREAKRRLNLDLVILEDSCPEGYEGKFYVGKLIEPDINLEQYVVVRPSLKDIVKEMEEYINE